MPFGDESHSDEGIVWPGYVDFLYAFVFVLIIFIGSLLYLLSGDIGDRVTDGYITPVEAGLKGGGVEVIREGNKLIISLKGKVEFTTNQVQIRREQEKYLRVIGPWLKSEGLQRIVIQGLADSQQCPSDPFCNWDYSARRAQEVLKFFYNCTECGYTKDLDRVRKLLIVWGNGDTGSTGGGLNSSQERRVDIILDFNPRKE